MCVNNPTLILYVVVVIDIEPIRERFSAVAPFLDERGRRLVAAAEAFAAGYGGITAVALATGVAPSAGPEGIGAGRAVRADSATGSWAEENDLQGSDAAPRSRGAGRAYDTR